MSAALATTTLVRPEVVDSFVATVVRCLHATVGVEAVIAAVHAPITDAPITVALELCGDVRGPVTWIFPPEIALELVRRLLSDPNPPADAATDGATELANILTGHATEILEAHGFRCELGTPYIPEGETPRGWTVQMTTPQGPIDLVISIVEHGD